jgi:hypothetical protein
LFVKASNQSGQFSFQYQLFFIQPKGWLAFDHARELIKTIPTSIFLETSKS